MTAKQILAQLITLCESTFSNHYKRISMAESLLHNKEWIVQEFQGDSWEAARYLEDACFHDLTSLMSLWDMLEVLQAFPHEKQWKEHKYNIRKMKNEIDRRHLPKVKPERKPSQKVPKAEYDALLRQRNRLMAQVNKLEVENAALVKRIAELESRFTKV